MNGKPGQVRKPEPQRVQGPGRLDRRGMHGVANSIVDIRIQIKGSGRKEPEFALGVLCAKLTRGEAASPRVYSGAQAVYATCLDRYGRLAIAAR